MLTEQIEKRLTEHVQKEKQDQRKIPPLSPLTNRGKTNRTKSKTPTATCRNRGWSFTSRLMLWSVRSCQPNKSTGRLNNQGLPCSGYPMSPRRGMVQSKLAFNANDFAGIKRTSWFLTPACPVQLPRLTRNLHSGEEPGTYPTFNIAEFNSKSGFMRVAPCQGNTKTLTENPNLANLFSIILCQSHKTLANIGENKSK